MPLVAIALAVYSAGLLAGFAHSIIVVAAAVVASCGVGYRRGVHVAIALTALAAAGAVVAHSTGAEDARCLERASTATWLRVVVSDSAAPGAYVRGQLAECDAAVSLSVQRGVAAAESVVEAHGLVTRTQRGILVQHAAVVVVEAPPLRARWRGSAGRAIDRTFGSDAPLVRALLIADRHQLEPDVRERFAAAGLAHILAIAGLHIGIIALAVSLALGLLGVAKQRASIITAIVVVVYVVIIGAPIPAVRSAAMLVTALISRIAQRPTSRWAIVALGATQPVFAPRVVLDVGYQLSVVGVAAMIAAAQLTRRIHVHRLPWLAQFAAATLIGTTVATIASAPIVAWVFGRVSVVAPLSNLAAAPLIALAQPLVFCGLIASPIHPVATLIADAAHPLLAGLDAVARVVSTVPFGSVIVSPTVVGAVVAGIMSCAVIVACASKAWVRPTVVAATAAACLVWLPMAPRGAGLLELHMLDVGQGDAIALRTPHGHWILVDAGRAWHGGDAGRATVVPYLGQRGGPLDVFILSHPHTDHVGGAASVLDALKPETYIDAGFPGPAEAYRNSLEAARRDHVLWRRAHPGDTLTVDGVRMTLLAPDSTWTASLDDPNLASVVVLARYGVVRMLFMGDAEEPEENWLLAHGADVRADILKVGHHGSRTSSSQAFLDAVRPRLALVSVGAGNSYGLPTPAIMHRLASFGAQVLRTDRLGTIVARTDGQRVFVDAAGDEWELPQHSPQPSMP